MALAKIYRLPLRTQRSRLNKEGIPSSSKFFTLISSPLESNSTPRFAILVSKKVSPLAVTRNHLKRQIVEIVSSQIKQLPPFDYLIIPKKNSVNLEYQVLHQDLTRLLHDKKSI